MADEQYRRFYSGRFGPERIDIDFATKIADAKGGTDSNGKKKPEPEGTGPDPSSEEAIRGYSDGGY